MSDHSGEQLSRGSSQSLFSGFGTSSISGPSESGHVNVEDFSVDQLEIALAEAKGALKLAILETIMFENYFDRLCSGQIHSSGNGLQTNGSFSRKGSGTLAESDSTSETDSQPVTASGISLLEVSRGHSTRKRSSSRTSLGNRGKSLRLTLEQKCGIAHQEDERISRDLALFRQRSAEESRESHAAIDERKLKLEEMIKQRAILTKALHQARGHGKLARKLNYDIVTRAFKDQCRDQNRLLQRLRIKNGVMLDQIKDVKSKLRTLIKTSEESGPIDLEQLELENANHSQELFDNQAAMVRLRQQMAITRHAKRTAHDLLARERRRAELITRSLAETRQITERTRQSIECLEEQIQAQIIVLEERQTWRKVESESMFCPTQDQYVTLKVEQYLRLKQARTRERKVNLKSLSKSMTKGENSRIDRCKSARIVGASNQSQSENQAPKLIRGRSFNICFQITSTSNNEGKDVTPNLSNN